MNYLLLNAGALRARRCFSFLISSCLPLKINLHGISNPPCSRFEEYLLSLITTQSIVRVFNKNNDLICDNWLGRWNTTTLSLKLPPHIYHQNSTAPFYEQNVQLLQSMCFDRYGNYEYNCLAHKSPFYHVHV